jgi:hypothetical protein
LPVDDATSPVGAAGMGGIGRALATLDGAESPARFVARTRTSYQVPLVRNPSVNVQHELIGYRDRCQPPLVRYSTQYITLGVALAFQRSVICPFPAVAVSPVGAAGIGGIGRALATLDIAELPCGFVAASRNSYVLPLVSSDTVVEQQVVIGIACSCHDWPIVASR